MASLRLQRVALRHPVAGTGEDYQRNGLAQNSQYSSFSSVFRGTSLSLWLSLVGRIVCGGCREGPLRGHWERKMASLRLQRVALRTLWLEPGDYPRILGSADLGVSLQHSSSGWTCPWKVVDMFGCSLPVCALAYSWYAKE